jgi:hypothetical protein
MFRKIHSNRDPKDTLMSELQKEFGRYFSVAGNLSERVMDKNPRLLFGCMAVLLAGSLFISFTYFRHREPAKKVVRAVQVSPVGDGIAEILRAGERLRMTLQLKHFVDSISSKKSLSAADSLALDSALDRLQSIQKSIK